MATTRLIPLHCGKGRSIGTAIRDIIDYVKNPEKTDEGRLITSWQCDSRIADAQFAFDKRQYLHKTGRERGADDVIAYHMRQSFVPGEITPEEANRLGCELVRRFTKGNHAYIVCTHIDKHHVHNHIIWNSTALTHDRKFRNFWGSTKALHRLSDTICIENGYSVVENPKRRGQSYNKWLGETAPTHRERICRAIDAAIEQKPQDFEVLLSLLRGAGYEIKDGKVPALRGGEQKRFIRMDSLGEDYTPENLCAVLAGEKEHVPRKAFAPKSQKNEKTAGSLLIDIQAKMQEGKGTGYAYWAKKYNLKQLAQTVAYLQEHDLMEYDMLAEKSEAVSTEFHRLTDQIKAAEKRMDEISTMRTQIINYAKTRDTYVAYRKAGYSKKFREKHESELIIHKTAKKFFDEKGMKKLPVIKDLQVEYAVLAAEKKAAYSKYRRVRQEMKELLTAKSNVNQILRKEDERPAQKTREKAI